MNEMNQNDLRKRNLSDGPKEVTKEKVSKEDQKNEKNDDLKIILISSFIGFFFGFILEK
ncbi:hypothetical protein BpHYR1_041422, partial [Brachionus plicatilis]